MFTTLLQPFTGLTVEQAKSESIRFGLALIDLGHGFTRHPIPGGWVIVSDGKAVRFLTK